MSPCKSKFPVTRTAVRLDCAVLCLVALSCLTLCDPMDCSPPGSSVHGNSPGNSTWVAKPSSGGYSRPRDQTQVSHFAGRFFTTEPPGKPLHSVQMSEMRFRAVQYQTKSVLLVCKPGPSDWLSEHPARCVASLHSRLLWCAKCSRIDSGSSGTGALCLHGLMNCRGAPRNKMKSFKNTCLKS